MKFFKCLKGGSASKIKYNNSLSGLNADNVQSAIDGLNDKFKWKRVTLPAGSTEITLPYDSVDCIAGFHYFNSYSFVIPVSILTTGIMRSCIYDRDDGKIVTTVTVTRDEVNHCIKLTYASSANASSTICYR